MYRSILANAMEELESKSTPLQKATVGNLGKDDQTREAKVEISLQKKHQQVYSKSLQKHWSLCHCGTDHIREVKTSLQRKHK